MPRRDVTGKLKARVDRDRSRRGEEDPPAANKDPDNETERHNGDDTSRAIPEIIQDPRQRDVELPPESGKRPERDKPDRGNRTHELISGHVTNRTPRGSERDGCGMVAVAYA